MRVQFLFFLFALQLAPVLARKYELLIGVRKHLDQFVAQEGYGHVYLVTRDIDSHQEPDYEYHLTEVGMNVWHKPVLGQYTLEWYDWGRDEKRARTMPAEYAEADVPAELSINAFPPKSGWTGSHRIRTADTTHEQLFELAKRIGGRRIAVTGHNYCVDFAVKFVLAAVSASTRAHLVRGSYKWPLNLREADTHFHVSAFLNAQIPIVPLH